MNAQKGNWVEIENVVLEPGQRATHLPEDTKKTPLMMWLKGFLETESATIGDKVRIRTLTGRTIEGKLVEINPRHKYDYGETIKELIQIDEELRQELAIHSQRLSSQRE